MGLQILGLTLLCLVTQLEFLGFIEFPYCKVHVLFGITLRILKLYIRILELNKSGSINHLISVPSNHRVAGVGLRMEKFSGKVIYLGNVIPVDLDNQTYQRKRNSIKSDGPINPIFEIPHPNPPLENLKLLTLSMEQLIFRSCFIILLNLFGTNKPIRIKLTSHCYLKIFNVLLGFMLNGWKRVSVSSMCHYPANILT